MLHGGFLTKKELSEIGFRKIGRDVKVSRLASIYGAENITLGDFCRIDDFNVISASGPVHIGDYVHVANQGSIIAKAELVLEEFSGVSSGVRIYTASDNFSGKAMAHPTIPEKYTNVTKAPVKVSRHAIIGANSVVLPGVTLEEGVAVGACSLVIESLAKWGIYGGVPAKFIKSRSKNLLKLEKEFIRSKG